MRMPARLAIQQVPTSEIVALHAPVDASQVFQLARYMREDGWQGRPLLVEERSDGKYQAWTGSHRIAAARRALDMVPVVVVDAEPLVAAGAKRGRDGTFVHGWPLSEAQDDEERLEMLRELGPDDWNAVRLVRQEVYANWPEKRGQYG